MNANTKNKLVWCAVPTLFNVPNPPQKVTPKRTTRKRCATEITSVKEEELVPKKLKVEDTPTKKKLRRTVKNLRTELYRSKKALNKKANLKVEQVLGALKSFGLSDTTVSFLEGRIRLCQKKKQGYRYAVRDKMLTLSIYYQSRKAYKLLSKIFILPSRSTLQRSLQNTNISPGFNNTVLDALKLKVQSMNQKDRNVALMFDEMSLKSAVVYNPGLDVNEGFEDVGE